MGTAEVFAENEAWAKAYVAADPAFFSRLSLGQKPWLLYIGCSDSRVTAEDMMGLGPGEALVHRNIANLVPPSDPAAAAVVHLAVEILGVEDVVVCGHYECSGVGAALLADSPSPMDPWLGQVKDTQRHHAAELESIATDETRLRRLVELSVERQCQNLLDHPSVASAQRTRGLRVHRWVFDIAQGRIIDLGKRRGSAREAG